MKINKNILLKLRKLIKSDYLKSNSCIILALIIFGSISSSDNKSKDFKVPDYKTSQTILVDSDLNDNLDEILDSTEQVVLYNNNCDENNLQIVGENNPENIDENNLQIIVENNLEITDEMKIQDILEKFNLTKEQFDVIVAIVLSEAKGNSYEDAYAVINTIYNRTISTNWVNYISYLLGDKTGTSLYYQSICPGQFIVYEKGIYLKFLHKDNTDEPGYRAIIDFLTTGEKMHDLLSFVGSGFGCGKYIQFVVQGNCYSNKLSEDELIPAEDRIFDFDLKIQDVEVFKNTGIEYNQEKVKVLKEQNSK